jgi:hypothetical protein
MKEYQLDRYQFYHQYHVMVLDQTKVGIMGQLNLYAWTSYIMSTVIQLPFG